MRLYQKNITDIHNTRLMDMSVSFYSFDGKFMDLFAFEGVRDFLGSINFEIYDDDAVITIEKSNLEFPNLLRACISLQFESFRNFISIENFLKFCPNLEYFYGVVFKNFSERNTIVNMDTEIYYWDSELQFLWTYILVIHDIQEVKEYIEHNKIIDNISRSDLIQTIRFKFMPDQNHITFCANNFKNFKHIVLTENPPDYLRNYSHSLNLAVRIKE